MATNAQTTHESTDPPGYYLGTDGVGWEHWYQSGSRRVTIDDGENRRAFKIPEREKALIDWCRQLVLEHEEAWEEVNVEEPYRGWLTGERPVGVWPDEEDEA